MRVLFVSAPWLMNLHAMVPLAWALRGAGHEVRVAGGPALASETGAAGLQAVVTGPDSDFPSPHGHHPGNGLTPEERREAAAELLRICDAMAGDLVAFGRSWCPDLVVLEPAAVAGPLVAAVLGVPAVRHLWGPDIVYELDDLQGPALAATLERFGLTGLRTLGELTVDPSPASLRGASAKDQVFMRYIPFDGSGEIPRWPLDPPGRPRVLVTWGAGANRTNRPEESLPPGAAAALSELDVEVVLAMAPDQREPVGEPPKGARVLESVPLHTVLPSCAAVVHRGDSGTTLTVAASGVPQLIVPQSPDQAQNAVRVEAAGAGLMCDPREDGAPAVRERLGGLTRRLLEEPGFGDAAQRLKAEIEALPAPWEVVAVLERLARERIPV
jgi:UDP:flavonoid glycosyltransferase YjiC (YdhE family)